MDDEAKVIVERMSNVGTFELYRFASEETEAVVCKVALRLDENETGIEYGVWNAEDAEPSATGKLDWEADGEWNDKAREAALRGIAELYEDEMPEIKNGLEIEIGDGEDDEDDDDDDEGEDEWDDDDDA